MSGIFKAFLIILVPLLLLLGGGIVYWYTMDASVWRDQLTAYASKKLGRTLTVVELSPSFSLATGFGVSLKGVQLANASGFSPKNMLVLDEAELVIDPFALLSRNLQVRKVLLNKADVILESRGDVTNWNFADKTAEDTKVKVPTGSDAPSMTIGIDAVDATDLKIAKIADGQKKVYAVQSLHFEAPTGGRVALKMDAKADADDIRLDITAGSLEDVQSGAKQPLVAVIEYGSHHMKVRGNYRRQGDTHSVTEAEIFYGDVAGTGSVAFDMGAVPGIGLDIKMPTLDLADVGKAKGGVTNAHDSGGADGRVFSRSPLPWDVLKAMNLNATVDIGKLENDGRNLGPANIQAKLNGGQLVSTVVMQPPGAREPIITKVNASAAQRVNVGISAPSLEPTLLFSWLGSEPILQAPAKFMAEFSGGGVSVHDVMASSNGQAVLEFMPGTLNIKALPVSVSGALASLVGMDQLQGAKLACAKLDFGLVNGVATARGIGMDSLPVIMAGEGNINLGGETANLRIVAEPRIAAAKGVRFPIYVKGDLAKPTAFADTAAIAGQVTGTVADTVNKLVGEKTVAATVTKLLGEKSKDATQPHIKMPFNPCRPNDVDQPPAQQQPVQPTPTQPLAPAQSGQDLKQRLDAIQKDPGAFIGNLLGGSRPPAGQ
ncbi:MAG: AsmA family protein [Bdellovibrionales bacterium]